MRLARTWSNMVLMAAILALACMLVPMTAMADEGQAAFTEGGLVYEVASDSAVSVGVQFDANGTYAGPSQVILPESVTHEGHTYAVTGIDASAFSGCSQLESVSIPVTVTSIGNFAFANCPNLQSVVFEQPDALQPALTCGQGTFSSSVDAANKLTSIELPARLAAVPTSMFQRQTALRTLSFAGDSIGSIGQYAFNACTALEYIEIPALTKSGKLGTGAFYELPNVKTVIFKGDIDYNLPNEFLGIEVITHNVSYMDVVDTYRYPDVQTVVFNGKRSGYTMSKAFDGANRYQRISFYESADAVQPISTALVNVDVVSGNINSALTADDIYEGSIPSLEPGMSWYFAGTAPTQPVGDSCSTYPVSNTSLAHGSIVLEDDELSTITDPVEPRYTVYAPDGTAINPSTLRATYTDAAGAAVAASNLVSPGTYTLTVASADGSYTGSVSTQFRITRAQSTWSRLDGNAYYALGNHIVSAAFSAGSCETALLVPRSALAEGAAVAALAGAYHAPIIVTNDNVSDVIDADNDLDHLNAEARYSLALVKPSRVILVGYTRDQRDNAQAFVRKVLPNATYPTFSNTAEDIAAAALSVYDISKKVNTTGLTVSYGSTAIVANASDATYAFAMAPFAYRELAPMFLSMDGKSLAKGAVNDIVSDGFTRVILTGPSSVVSKSIETQLKNAGFKGEIVRWGDGSNVYRSSIGIAEAAVGEGVLAYDNLALAGPADAVSALMGAAVCGENGSPLVFASAKSNGNVAVDNLVKAHLGSIKQGFVLGTRANIPESMLEDIRSLWTSGIAGDLNAGSITLASTALSYTGSAVLPKVTVRDASGVVLPESAYSLTYFDEATDRQMNAAEVVEPGTYSVTAQGAGTYSGTRTAVFTVKIAKGTTIKEGSVTYKATSDSALQVVKVAASTNGSLVIPASVKGLAVTSIGAQAFKGCTKLTGLTVKSAKLASIGGQAFFNCKKLKSMTFKSKKISSVGAKAFAKVNAKATVKVPKAKVNSYKTLFTKAGLPSTATVKKG